VEGVVIVSDFRLVDAAERGMEDSLVPRTGDWFLVVVKGNYILQG